MSLIPTMVSSSESMMSVGRRGLTREVEFNVSVQNESVEVTRRMSSLKYPSGSFQLLSPDD